jgi:hypothetical protein
VPGRCDTSADLVRVEGFSETATAVRTIRPRAPSTLWPYRRDRRRRDLNGHADDVGGVVLPARRARRPTLFAGFPGFVSKLWFANDERGVYRGLHNWRDPASAEAYVRSLWWALIVVSKRASIHYAVLPGIRWDDLLKVPHLADDVAVDEPTAWWPPDPLGAPA